jgi:hypothetical protein
MTARLVRRKDGAPIITDGPYLETKEYISTFYLLDCESEERAYAIAADMPWADINPTGQSTGLAGHRRGPSAAR